MPIYNYRCIKCSHEFEKLMLGTNPDPPMCPQCESSSVIKQLSCPRSSGIRITGGQRFLNNGKTDC